jgi:hypothetical protein
LHVAFHVVLVIVIIVTAATSSGTIAVVVVVRNAGRVLGERRHLPLAFRSQFQLPLPKLTGFEFTPQFLLQPRLLVDVLLLDFGKQRGFVCAPGASGCRRRRR